MIWKCRSRIKTLKRVINCTNSKNLESITDNSEIKTNEDEEFLQTAEDSMDIEETYPDQTFENMELNGNNQEPKTPEIRIEDAGFEEDEFLSDPNEPTERPFP